MRSSACTCPGEDHPGPNVNTARSAPEIDIIEAQIQTDRNTGTKHSYASQSLQVAPFDTEYYFHNKSTDYTLYDTDTTKVSFYPSLAPQILPRKLTNDRILPPDQLVPRWRLSRSRVRRVALPRQQLCIDRQPIRYVRC